MTPDLFNKEIFEFIKANASADPFELSLRIKHFPDNIRKLIADQILSRQKLQKKVPEWMAFDELILPGTLSVEQASSSKTAGYKSGLLKGGTLMDITGGLGVDTSFFARHVEKVIYIEKDQDIADIAAYNFRLMGFDNVEVLCGSAEKYLKEWVTQLDYIYLDPSRRTKSGKVFRLEESEPNLIIIQDDLLQRSGKVITKASPFLDINYALRRVKNISEVHVLAVDNECKEIILISDPHQATNDPPIIMVNQIGNTYQRYLSSIAREQNSVCKWATTGRFIFDPNAAIRKAGLFRSICMDFGLRKPSDNSHIYFGDTRINNFPGRIFEQTDIISYNKFMKRRLFEKANIAVRNFPLSVDEIRKKSGIREGGEVFIFGTTDQNKNIFFIVCRKVK